jgi:hypothetical protein
MAELVLNDWRNDRRGVVHNRTRQSLLRDVFSHVASQDLVNEALVPDAAAACFLAELIEHPGIDANGDQRFTSSRRPDREPNCVQTSPVAGFNDTRASSVGYLNSLGAKSFRARRQVSHSCAVSGDSK